MIIAIFILQKLHQIEISPLSHKYHVLLLRGSMCRNSVETFWGLLWFFLSTQWLSLVLSPFPAEQGGGFGGQENFMATGNLFPWEWAKWAKGRGRNGFIYFFLSLPWLPPCSPHCADSAHHHPSLQIPGHPLPLPSAHFLTCPLVLFQHKFEHLKPYRNIDYTGWFPVSVISPLNEGGCNEKLKGHFYF